MHLGMRVIPQVPTYTVKYRTEIDLTAQCHGPSVLTMDQMQYLDWTKGMLTCLQKGLNCDAVSLAVDLRSL